MDEYVLYSGATIHTMNRAMPRAQALLVRGDRIAAIGDSATVEAAAPSGTRRVDLDGRTVIPGFNDCHCHILTFGLNLDQLDVGAGVVHSIEDIRRAVASRAELTAAGEWILGRGYNQNDLAERRHPHRWDLDGVSGGRPVLLRHTSGHALTCNSRALELAGITAETATPPGGEIERNDQGQPTGVLKEEAMSLVSRVVPQPTLEQGTQAILRAMEMMAGQGITSASDAFTGLGDTIDPVLAMYRAALDSGRLAGRITLMPHISYVAPPDSDTVRPPDEFDAGPNPDWLKVGATKIFSDGALTTRTAAVFEPFADSSDNRGILIWEKPALQSMIQRAHDAGWQIGTHAIGDRAIATVLDCYAEAIRENPRQNHRHRIEHCMLLDDVLAERIRDLGVIPTIQPGFIASLGDAYVAALGKERADRLNPMALFDRFGITVGFSSDRPVIPGLPLEGIRSAMERRTPAGEILGEENTIGPLEAVGLYTVGSAFAVGDEVERGALRPGSLADFTVLSRDPEVTPAEEITDIEIALTVAGGKVTWEN